MVSVTGFDLLDDCRSPTRAMQYALDYMDIYNRCGDNQYNTTLRLGTSGAWASEHTCTTHIVHVYKLHVNCITLTSVHVAYNQDKNTNPYTRSTRLKLAEPMYTLMLTDGQTYRQTDRQTYKVDVKGCIRLCPRSRM